MKFNYKEYGDILYRHESYGFRYNSGTSKIQTIDIRLTHMLDDDKFAYEIDLKDDQEFIINGKKIKRFGSADFDLYQSLGSGIQYQTLFNTREQALQHAIDTFYVLFDKNEVKK